MIILQTTTIVFEYPQDYLQEQEWCKTKDDRWIHKSIDTLGSIYEYQISYSIGALADRKTENNSEKPNNCEECKHWNDTEDGCADRHGCMTEPQTTDYCDVCNHKGCDNCVADGSNPYCMPSHYESKNEPQTERRE